MTIYTSSICMYIYIFTHIFMRPWSNFLFVETSIFTEKKIEFSELLCEFFRHRKCDSLWYYDNPWEGSFQRLSEYICAVAHSDLALSSLCPKLQTNGSRHTTTPRQVHDLSFRAPAGSWVLVSVGASVERYVGKGRAQSAATGFFQCLASCLLTTAIWFL